MSDIPESPRLKHNRELTEAYLKTNNIYSRYPRVCDQLECVPMNTGTAPPMFPFGYNPTIIDSRDGMLMAYRYHNGSSYSTQVALVTVSKDGAVIDHQPLTLPGNSQEDPKLYQVTGYPEIMFMSYVDSTFPKKPWTSIVRFAEFTKSSVVQVTIPELPGNDNTGMQKNWVPFIHDDRPYCIYQCHPTHQVYDVMQPEKVFSYETETMTWPYGDLRGGTSPIEYEGHLLRFFHSSLDNEFGMNRRRYFVGALLMQPAPPFAITRVSKRPVLYGSEIDRIKVKERPFHHKPNVVFPGGVVTRNGYFLLSVGTNDSACEIVKVTPKDLNL